MSKLDSRGLAQRIVMLPEPYRANLVEWFARSIDQPIKNQRELAAAIEDLINASHMEVLSILMNVLDETEHFFGDGRRPRR